MTRRLLPLLALAAVAITSLAFTAAYHRPAPPTTVITVVELEKALSGLDERTAKNADLEASLGEIRKKIEGLERQIKEKNDNLKLLPAGPEKKTATEQLRRLVAEYDVEGKLSERLLNEQTGEVLKEIYEKLDRAAETVAKKNGYTIVLSSDERVEIKPGEAEDIVRTISLKRMLYVDPAHDITDEIITLMNNEYATTKGATGAGTKPPTTPPAAGAKPAAPATKPAPKKP